jgi:hypothetical protein
MRAGGQRYLDRKAGGEQRREGRRRAAGPGGTAGRAGGSSSAAGLPLDGEDFYFDFRSRGLRCEDKKCGGGFYKNKFGLTARHLFRAGGSIFFKTENNYIVPFCAPPQSAPPLEFVPYFFIDGICAIFPNARNCTGLAGSSEPSFLSRPMEIEGTGFYNRFSPNFFSRANRQTSAEAKSSLKREAAVRRPRARAWCSVAHA